MLGISSGESGTKQPPTSRLSFTIVMALQHYFKQVSFGIYHISPMHVTVKIVANTMFLYMEHKLYIYIYKIQGPSQNSKIYGQNKWK
jgi:hypothetical protein